LILLDKYTSINKLSIRIKIFTIHFMNKNIVLLITFRITKNNKDIVNMPLK